jgi:uncharacterized protein (TIGR03086 family)
LCPLVGLVGRDRSDDRHDQERGDAERDGRDPQEAATGRDPGEERRPSCVMRARAGLRRSGDCNISHTSSRSPGRDGGVTARITREDAQALQMRQSVQVIDDLDEAAEAMRRVIAGSSSGDGWNLPSPCAGWTVRDVINHVVTGNLRTLAWTNTDNGPPNEDDYLGADPLGAFNASFRELRARLAELLARDAAVQTPFAVLSADRLIEMRCCELAVHAWDVARATSQSTDFAPEVYERVLVIVRARMQGLDRARGPFGAEQPSRPGASAADRLAAFLGRASGA